MKNNRRSFFKVTAAATLLPAAASAQTNVAGSIPAVVTLLLDEKPSFFVGQAASVTKTIATPVRLASANSGTVQLRQSAVGAP